MGGRDLRLRIDQIRLCTFSKLEFSSYFTVSVLLYLQSYPGILQVIKCMYKDRGFFFCMSVCICMFTCTGTCVCTHHVHTRVPIETRG